jgi:hypothetical protein
MSQRIIDLLEIIKIDTEHGKACTSARLVDSLFNPLGEQRPVWQSGQSVVPRHEGDLRLSPLLFGYIFTTDEPAAIGCGAMSDRDDASVAELLEVVTALAASQKLLAFGQKIGHRLAAMISGGNTQAEDILERHPWKHKLRRNIKDLAEAPVDHLQPSFSVIETESLRHVRERRIQSQIGRMQFGFLVLQTANVAVDEDDAALLGRAAADPQPSSVRELGLALHFFDLVSVLLEHEFRRVLGAGRAGRPQRMDKLRRAANELARSGIGQRDLTVLVEEDDALTRVLERIGKPRLRRTPLRHLSIDHRPDVVPHSAHSRQERTQLVTAALRNACVQIAIGDALGRFGRDSDGTNDPPRQQPGEKTGQKKRDGQPRHVEL